MFNKDIALTGKVSSKSKTSTTITFHKTFKNVLPSLAKKWLSGAINGAPSSQRTMTISNTNCL